MRVDIIEVERMPLEEFADLHGLTMTVRERDPGSHLPRYFAYFANVEIHSLDKRFLSSAAGNGDTVQKAIAAYAKGISRKPLVIDATQSTRRELWSPVLTVAVGTDSGRPISQSGTESDRS